MSDIAAAQRHANPNLALLGVAVCAMPRPKTRLVRELTAYVERTCVDADRRTLKFSTEISRSVVVRAALAVVMESESKIREELEQQNFRLPPTHDRLALSDFEDRWRRSLQGAPVR